MKKTKTYIYGGLTVRDGKSKLTVNYAGNMGSNKDSVNESLVALGFRKIENLKKIYPNFTENGSPDYLYTIIFKK